MQICTNHKWFKSFTPFTYLLRASSAALSFGLKNKTELKNVTDRLNRWCFIVFEMLLCASGPGLDIIQLLLLKHLHNYTFLGPKILKIKPKKTPTSQTSTSASGGATSSALLQGHHLYKCYLKNPKKYSSVSNLFWSSFSNNTQKTVNWFARGLNEPFNYCSCCQQQKQLRLKISTSTYLLTRSSIERLNEEMEKIKTFVKLYSQNHEERGYTTPTSGRATTTSQTPTPASGGATSSTLWTSSAQLGTKLKWYFDTLSDPFMGQQHWQLEEG